MLSQSRDSNRQQRSLWKHVYTVVYLEKTKIGGVREPRGAAEAVSTAHHRAQQGDAQIIIDPGCKVQAKEVEACGLEAAPPGSCTPPAPLSSWLHKGDHPAERVGRAAPSFSAGMGHRKPGWVSLRLPSKCNPKHRITTKLCCVQKDGLQIVLWVGFKNRNKAVLISVSRLCCSALI